MSRPLVLISNDDGIDAPGIATLFRILSELADCMMVAPAGPQSRVGHALGDGTPILVERRGERSVAVSGSPAECARIGLAAPDVLPDTWREARHGRRIWLVSGINHGANLGVDTYVSGTAAAAREAAILGFPSLAISQYVGRHRRLDWERAARRAAPVLSELLERPPAAGHFWNVNLPHPHDDGHDCEIVHCPPDPSPMDVRFERRGGHFADIGDFHQRPRLPDHDVDVCFGGRISVSQIGL